MNEWNDSELREALRRREARRPRTEVTEDFVNGVMREIEASEHPGRLDASANRRPWRIALAALAAAASIVLVFVWTWPATQSDTSNQIIGHVQSVNRIRRVAQSDTSNRSNGQSSHSIVHVQNNFGQVQLGNRTKLLTNSICTNKQPDTSNWSNGQSNYSIGHVQNNFGQVQLGNRTKLLTNCTSTNRQPYKYKSSTGHVQSVNRTCPISQSAISNHEIGHAQSAADSLEYYISCVEAQLSKISDSCYEAQVERLIRVDDRLSRLVNRIIMDGIITDTLRHTALSE